MAGEELGMLMQGNSLQRLPPNASKEQQTAVINDILDRLNELLKTQVLSDGNNKRMLFGYQKDGWGPGKDFGIKISEEGVDVTAATDEQLLFSMDMETWRWFEPDTSDNRNYVNIGLRSTGTYGFEMAKPGDELDDPA